MSQVKTNRETVTYGTSQGKRQMVLEFDSQLSYYLLLVLNYKLLSSMGKLFMLMVILKMLR